MSVERDVQAFVGGLILSTGVMKLVVPKLRAAWGAQLDHAELPFRDITYQVFPLVEIGVGAMLATHRAPRASALAVISMMAGATYVHLVVDDPDLFPLQPKQPVVPLGVTGLALYLLAKPRQPLR
jgi:uncharacterized membrane protein YphA (DoxX/SURF4 family)